MCPNCKISLIVLEMEGIEIDYCTECNGVWLDEGEIEMILKLEGAEPDTLANELFATKPDAKSDKRCVRCNAKMQMVKVGEPLVAIDRCPLGDGVWFDQGEMQTLIQSSHTDAKGIVAQFFAELYQSDTEDNAKGETQ